MVKKLTVIGIIGNRQGVSSADNPNMNASRKKVHKVSSVSACGVLIGLVAALNVV